MVAGKLIFLYLDEKFDKAIIWVAEYEFAIQFRESNVVARELIIIYLDEKLDKGILSLADY